MSKLRDLKTGQKFKFVGKDKREFEVIEAYPSLCYKAINGHINYRPTYATRPNKEVIIIDETPLSIEIKFTDGDGDYTIFTTETEADFIHVLVNGINGKGIAALSRADTVQLVSFLQRHLDLK